MKKSISILLSITIIISMLFGIESYVYALDSTGSCGANASYAFDSATGELSITGSGELSDYSLGKSPFFRQSTITSVSIADGITYIGNNTFSYCSGITQVDIADSVSNISSSAFSQCTALQSVTIPSKVKQINTNSFVGCKALKEVVIKNPNCYLDNTCLPSDVTIVCVENSLVNKYATDSLYAFESRACNLIGIEHNNGASVKENIIDSSCSKDGSYDEVVYCTLCNSELSRTQKTIDKLPHTPVIDEAVEAKCNAVGLTQGSHCKICNEVIVAQTQVDKLNHKYKNYIVRNSTCTEKGLLRHECLNCEYQYDEELPLRSHIEEIDNAVKPTCEMVGYTEGKHCKVCHKVLVEQQIIEQLGHDYAESIIKSNKCNECDYEVYTCRRCPRVQKRPISAVKSHAYDAGVVTKAPTSSATGVMTYTCKACKSKKTASIAKLPKVSGLKLTSQKKAFKVSWKKVSSATGYQIQFSTDSKFKKSPKTVTVSKNSTTSKKINSLKAKKKYYVRIRIYKTIKGKKYYSSWSSSKSVTTK